MGLLGILDQGGDSRGKSLQSRGQQADGERLPLLPLPLPHRHPPLPCLLDTLNWFPRLGKGNHHFRLDRLFSLVNAFVMVPVGNGVKSDNQVVKLRLSPSILSTRGRSSSLSSTWLGYRVSGYVQVRGLVHVQGVQGDQGVQGV